MSAICFVCTTRPAMPGNFGAGYPEDLAEAERGRCESCALHALENVAHALHAEAEHLRAALEALRLPQHEHPYRLYHPGEPLRLFWSSADHSAAIDRALRGGA